MTCDAVAVGAGHNGLAAAVHLGAKGCKVAVIEGKSEPGGAVASGKASGVRLANGQRITARRP
ncbi:MAG TPA: NAD(P)-binding protein [Acidobacteriaceae bacterium]|jgi:phytoene dehydrogenase-like protein